MFVEQYIDNLGQSRTTPFRSVLDDDYLLALELQKEFDQQAEERNANAEVNGEQSKASAMQLQMEEEQQYQALHAREQKSSKRLALFFGLMSSDR